MLVSKIALSQIMLPAYQGVVAKIPTVVTPAFTCSTSTITDVDNNIYNTVLIGTQCWTKQNLKVTKYNDGTVIPLNNTHTSGTVSTVWQGLTTGAYAIYDNQASSGTNATNYGFLYNWYAVTDTKSICPAGWGIPTDAEWSTLTTFIGTNPGTKLKKIQPCGQQTQELTITAFPLSQVAIVMSMVVSPILGAPLSSGVLMRARCAPP